jgi:hypothetical protein
MDQTMRKLLALALMLAFPGMNGIAYPAQGLTDLEMDRVTGGAVASAVDASDFFAARADARGAIAKASAAADEFSAQATGSAKTIASDSDSNAWSRAETVGTPPPPPVRDRIRLTMADLDRRLAQVRLLVSSLK